MRKERYSLSRTPYSCRSTNFSSIRKLRTHVMVAIAANHSSSE